MYQLEGEGAGQKWSAEKGTTGGHAGSAYPSVVQRRGCAGQWCVPMAGCICQVSALLGDNGSYSSFSKIFWGLYFGLDKGSLSPRM